jgi:hypothetical protein
VVGSIVLDAGDPISSRRPTQLGGDPILGGGIVDVDADRIYCVTFFWVNSIYPRGLMRILIIFMAIRCIDRLLFAPKYGSYYLL